MIVINELDLKQILKLFWSKKVFIVIMMIIFAILGAVKIEYFTTPVYKASGKLICARTEESISEGTMVTATELSTTSSLAETYAELIKSDLIVGQVIQNLGLDISTADLAKCVELTPVTKVYYEVTVKGTSKVETANIANELISVFSEEVKKIYQIDSIHIVDKAQVPEEAINMNIVRSMEIFALIGAVVAVVIIMLLFMLNNTVTNSEQIKKYTKLTTLASVPKYNGDDDLITVKDSKSPYAESIKILRTNLQYMYDKGQLQTVGVTSSLPGEGKSWVTANLAVAFANSGKKTLVIDADMRRGRQDKVFKVRRSPGLSEFLRADKENESVVTIKAKKVDDTGIARFLSKINKYIKIENIPAIADIIYKEEYITMSVNDNAKTKALKKESVEVEAEVAVEPEKKTRRKTTKKVEEKAESAKKTTRKTTKKAEEKVEPAKKTTRKTTTKKAEEKEEAVKKTTRRTTKTVAEEVTKQLKTTKPELKISDFVHETEIDNLYVLPAGRETIDSSELLSTERLKEILEELKKEYDIILVDTPPVSVVADGFIISRMVDTNMIVLKHGNTEINELNNIKNNIEKIGGDVIRNSY